MKGHILCHKKKCLRFHRFFSPYNVTYGNWEKLGKAGVGSLSDEYIIRHNLNTMQTNKPDTGKNNEVNKMNGNIKLSVRNPWMADSYELLFCVFRDEGPYF